MAETEEIENSYTLKPEEEISIICVYKYWAYAHGAENGPATLSVKWISYEDFIKEVIEKCIKGYEKHLKIIKSYMKNILNLHWSIQNKPVHFCYLNVLLQIRNNLILFF